MRVRPGMIVLAVDPGKTTGFVVAKVEARERFSILRAGQTKPPSEFLALAREAIPVCDGLIVEDVVPYGPASKAVLALKGFVERLVEIAEQAGKPVVVVPRPKVARELTGGRKSPGKGQVNAAVNETFAGGLPNRGRGSKKHPGPFFGVKGHANDALALVGWWLLYGEGHKTPTLDDLIQ